jgi:hypothetical protein
MVLLITSPVNASVEQLANVPVPVNTVVRIVSDDMIHNGSRVSLATYTSSLSLEESIDYYRGVWSGDTDSRIPGLVETQAGEWLMISRLRDGYNTVIQLRLAEPHKSTGFVSIMAIPGRVPNESSRNTVDNTNPIDGLQLLSSTQSSDGTRLSRLSVYSSSQSIESTTRLYVKHLLDQDWVVVSERVHAQSKVVLMNRKSQLVELVVIRETSRGGSVIVVNEIHDRG